jgi:hypothetical protein
LDGTKKAASAAFFVSAARFAASLALSVAARRPESVADVVARYTLPWTWRARFAARHVARFFGT